LCKISAFPSPPPQISPYIDIGIHFTDFAPKAKVGLVQKRVCQETNERPAYTLLPVSSVAVFKLSSVELDTFSILVKILE
jgi:hypothetical protein